MFNLFWGFFLCLLLFLPYQESLALCLSINGCSYFCHIRLLLLYLFMSILIPLFCVISCQSKSLLVFFFSLPFKCLELELSFWLQTNKLTHLPIPCLLEFCYPFVVEGFEEHKSGVWRRKHRANGLGFTSCS